jgi:inhibitor of KinA sporulation pathway (predicted exonuclease)
MKTIFNTTREELINRINSLNTNSKAQWGKMDVYQMLKNCTFWDEMMQSKQNHKRMFIG